MILFYENLR